jgi:thiosulfate/3-mercaptopyruvate sulfurtransferase
VNIPWSSFHRDPARPELGFKRGDDLKAVLAPALAKQAQGKTLVTSCGSGASAALINFAMEELSLGRIPLYDGSWSEYGNKPNAPIEK